MEINLENIYLFFSLHIFSPFYFSQKVFKHKIPYTFYFINFYLISSNILHTYTIFVLIIQTINNNLSPVCYYCKYFSTTVVYCILQQTSSKMLKIRGSLSRKKLNKSNIRSSKKKRASSKIFINKKNVSYSFRTTVHRNFNE